MPTQGSRGQKPVSLPRNCLRRARLARICRSDTDLPYFWPHYLGEKCETFDFLVELVDAGEQTPFFFVQVKATRKEFTKAQNPPRLRVNVAARVSFFVSR